MDAASDGWWSRASESVDRIEREMMLATIQQDRREPSTRAAPPATLVGRSFGDFRLVCPLASGGMASVYLARKAGPAQLHLHAALKIIHPHLAREPEFVDMFLDEARIAACLHHPNICLVLDFGVAEGTHYLVMEYLLGEPWSALRAALASHPEGRALVPAIAAHVIAEACAGLHAAHEATDSCGRPLQIVHRDATPQNIFVGYDGTVRVLDFGIARACDRITCTRVGTIKGRLAYMAPEQMLNDGVGRTADIWSCGVVLRESLEGMRLFRRKTEASTIAAVMTEPLPGWRAEVAPALRAIADRALARDPCARFTTAEQMGVELARFAASAPTPVASALLSRWMHALFAQELERKQARLRLAAAEPAPAPRLTRQSRQFAFSPRRPLALLALLLMGVAIAVTSWGTGAPRTRASSRAPAARAALGVRAAASFPAASRAPSAAHDLPAPSREAAQDASASQKAAPARARAAAVGRALVSGTLMVGFEGGWAEVYLGGRLLGTTPGRFVVPAGRPLLKIKPFGSGAALRRRVEVRPGTVTKLLLSASAK